MFNQLINFLQMGGYGFYIWSAYGIAAVILTFNLLMPWLQYRRLKKQNKT